MIGHVKTIREVYAFTKKPRGLLVANDSSVSFLPMATIPIGRIHVSTFEERLSSTMTSGTYIENGDLLVAKITPSFENGKQAIVDWKKPFGFATTEVIPIQEIEGVSDKFFLYHLLLHPEIRSDLAGKMDGTTGRQRLSKEVLGNSLIPLPPLSEQRKISGILGLVQRAMEQQEQLLALTTELKKVLLHQLFTHGLRGEPQKQTEIGPVPESWEVVELGNIPDKIIGGGTPSPNIEEYWNGDIEWTTSKRLEEFKIFISKGEKTITKLGLESSSTNLIPKNNIIISTRVTVGKVAINTVELAISQDLTGLFINSDKYSLQFVAYQTLTDRIQIFETQKRGATIKGLTREDLKSIKVLLPGKEEQSLITNHLSIIDNKIEPPVRKKNALTYLFRTLLHHLMTARIRVNDLHIEELECAV